MQHGTGTFFEANDAIIEINNAQNYLRISRPPSESKSLDPFVDEIDNLEQS